MITSHNILLAQPAQSMVSRQQQHYKTYYWHDPHKIWSPGSNNTTGHTDSNNITRCTAGMPPQEGWSPDSNNITRHTVSTSCTKHGLQTAINYKTCCWHDLHEAWSPANNITRDTVGNTPTVTYSWQDPQSTSITILYMLLHIPCTIIMRSAEVIH